MTRSWTSVLLTRLIIVSLAFTVFAMISGPFFARLTKKALHESTGWSWNFTLVSLDFFEGKMLIKDLYLVPPEGSRKEALIADQARVRVGSWGLLDRQMVFDSVEIEGVRSSSLDRLIVMNLQELWPLNPADSATRERPNAADSGRAWLDSFQIGKTRIPPPGSLDLKSQILGEWETELAGQVESISQAEAQLKKLHESMVLTSDNPLRSGSQKVETARQLQASTAATTAARNRYQLLVERRNRDIQRFVVSQNEDLRQIAAASHPAEIVSDERLANEALIRTEYERFSSHLCDWARSIRDSVIADGRQGQTVEDGVKQGRNIVFAGSHPKPGLVVKRLNLDGAAKMGTDHVDFVVVLDNLTDRIRLQPEPSRLQMRAQGKFHMLVSGEFRPDMTAELKVTCPEIAVGPMLLGHPGSIAVTVPGGSMSFVATINMEADSVHGSADIEQRTTGLKLEAMHVLLSSQFDQHLLDAELGKIPGFAGRVSFVQDADGAVTLVEAGPGRAFLSAISRSLVQAGGTQGQDLAAKIEMARQELEQQTGSVLELCSRRLDMISTQTRELVAQAESVVNPAGSSFEIRR